MYASLMPTTGNDEMNKFSFCLKWGVVIVSLIVLVMFLAGVICPYSGLLSDCWVFVASYGIGFIVVRYAIKEWDKQIDNQ